MDSCCYRRGWHAVDSAVGEGAEMEWSPGQPTQLCWAPQYLGTPRLERLVASLDEI